MATMKVVPKPQLAPMKVAQIPKPGADFEIVERPIPEPDAGQVRIKVKACGICHSGALPGDLVAVQGIGGLGHLGVQFANKFGYNVAAIGRGSENAVLAKKLGAHVYIDSQATNAAQELQKLGGARVILATAPSSKAMSALIYGLV